MKRNLIFIACVLISLAAIYVSAQQSIKPTPVYKLPAAASAKWIELDKQAQEIVKEANRQLQAIGDQQKALILGAGIPDGMQPTVENGSVVFKPTPSPTPAKEKP